MPHMIRPEWVQRAFAGESISAGGELHQFSVHRLGQIELPSGRLAASDPLVMWEPDPFRLTVKPGSYEVDVAVSEIKADQRVAFARVRFTDDVPQNWAMAAAGNDDVSKLGPSEIVGYGVDAGTGCFMSPEAGELLAKRMDRDESYSEAVIAEMDRTYRDTWCWARIQPEPTQPLGIIAFSSGLGDGIYASYVGSTDSGVPACLVTDFGILRDAVPSSGKRPWWRFW